MPPEVKLTILVDDQGTVKIKSLTEDLGRLERAAKQTGAGMAAGSKEVAAAGERYQNLGASVAMAQAKLLAFYGVVRGAQGLFTKGMESVDYYEKAVIRMAASAADSVKGITDEQELANYYERMKGHYRELVNYAQEASAKYFANAREILQVAEWATARGFKVDKKEIDNIGLLVDKIKQLVPWIRQEGQVLQELNALWEGHAKITDTLAKLVIDRLKQMGQITATEGKEVQEQFEQIMASWKAEGFGGFLERVMGLFRGAKLASKDVQSTWESTLETIQTVAERLASAAGKEIYRDIIQYLQGIAQEYLTGANAAEKQRAIADAVNSAWRTVKSTLADLRPVFQDIGVFLGEAWKAYQSMPESVREVGLVGFILVGAKGKAVILAVLGMLGRIETLLASIRAYAAGNLSLGDLFFGNKEALDRAIKEMEEYQRRMENIRLFREFEEMPKTKSPIKLMSYEIGAGGFEYLAGEEEPEWFTEITGTAEQIAQANQAIKTQTEMLAFDWTEAWRQAARNVQNTLADTLYSLLTQTKTAGDALRNIFNGLIRIMSDMAAQALMGLAKTGIQSITGSSWFGGLLSTVGGWLGGMFGGGSASAVLPSGYEAIDEALGGLSFKLAAGGVLPGPFIPVRAFARGGYVDRPTLGLVGEAGPEAIVPLNDYNKRLGGDIHIINVWDPAMVSQIAAQTMASETGRQVILNIVSADLAERGVTRRILRR